MEKINYLIALVARMNNPYRIFIAASILLFPFFGNSQYCTAVGPTSITWSNIETAFIAGESATSFTYTGCPGVLGLEDLTSTESVSLNAGGNYTLDVLFGTCDNTFPGAGEAWIDFDGSGTFDLIESIGTWQGTPPVPISNFNFTVPAACVNGPVRMRISHQESVTPPLNPCASYTWGNTLDIEIVLSGGTGGTVTNYCELGGPASTADSNIETLDITGEGGTAINYLGCPGVTGSNDQTAGYSVSLAKGASYTANVLFGTCLGNYPGVGEAWIDFNQNGVFEVVESIGTWQGTPPTAISNFFFTVPLTSVDGSSRMRIVQQEGGIFPLDPCGSFTFGSTTDFEVVIGGVVDCSGYTGDSLLDPRIVLTLPFSETHDNSYCYTNNVTVYNSPDVFYRLILADYGADYLNVSLCGSTIDTYLQILDTGSNVLYHNDDYAFCGSQSELTFSTAGHDTLYVVVQGWDTESGDYTIEINDAAVAELTESDLSLSVFPNPSNGKLTISSFSGQAKMQLTDLKGSTLLDMIIQPDDIIDVSSMESGMYLLKIEAQGKIYTQKIIIQL